MTLRWDSLRGISSALFTGFALALVTSAGIAGERLTGGNVNVAVIASTLVTAALVLVLARSMRLAIDQSVARTLGPQIAGAVLGIALVHILLRIGAHGASSLVERPAQFVNDGVATLAFLALLWSAFTRNVALGLLSVALVVAYRLTASWWHVDAIAVHGATVQQFVVAQFIGAAIGVTIFRALTSSEAGD